VSRYHSTRMQSSSSARASPSDMSARHRSRISGSAMCMPNLRNQERGKGARGLKKVRARETAAGAITLVEVGGAALPGC
jgi:hypothetical protein